MRTSLIKTEEQARASGRGTARGTSGSCWMAALDTIVDEAIVEVGIKICWSDNPVQMIEGLTLFAEGWTHSHQFEHEVGQFFSTSAEGEDRIYKLAELQDAWVEGYVEVLAMKIEKRCRKG